MKTAAKSFTTYGNLALVQLEVTPETTFNFRPGEPEIRAGRLIISEASGNGIVGKLVAENNTDGFLLLTDADVLIGAKQNRVLNRSVLLSPFSKTILDVSCIERRRWQYTSKDFLSTPTVADHDLRKDKAETIAVMFRKSAMEETNVQEKVWSHIHEKMDQENFESSTENYSDLLRFRITSQTPDFPLCNPEKACNALAVLIDRKIVCIDIFGTHSIYNHYFPKLRDSAFRQANAGVNKTAIGMHEAYFKVLDLLDNYEKEDRGQDNEYSAAGSFFIIENKEFIGFDLNIENQLIHNVIFLK
jgi:hypothetical protein